MNADREGFEPSVTLLPHTLSKRAHSTTLTPALGGRDARNSLGSWQSLFKIFENLFMLGCKIRLEILEKIFIFNEKKKK